MFNIQTTEIEWGGRKLVLETGRMARQADGAVLVTYGATVVLCTAVGASTPRVGIDFFPLTVNYQEKTFAAGKIPGGFFKREGRPSEKETLTSRLIDRPIRPLFAAGFKNETQVICTVLSHDLENDPDVVALVGASAALTISGIPFSKKWLASGTVVWVMVMPLCALSLFENFSTSSVGTIRSASPLMISPEDGQGARNEKSYMLAGGATEMKPLISGRRINSCMPIQAPKLKPATQQARAP